MIFLKAKKKPLTNKAGDVRELAREDIRAMKPISKILPRSLISLISKRKRTPKK
jgi:hypothetical protein